MQIINRPDKNDWKEILRRPYTDNAAVVSSVEKILIDVKDRGDEAVHSFTKKFDGVDIKDLQVTEEEFAAAEGLLSDDLKGAIQQAKKNIETFHKAQVKDVEIIETMPGVQCWRKSVAINKVGLYIPGGTAPLFSTVLMLGVPAMIAGCKEIILCTPASAPLSSWRGAGGEVPSADKVPEVQNGQEVRGAIHPAILYTSHITGIKTIFKIGGAQAIAAMAYGTQTIPAVYKIFGPGNQYVTAAKQLVQMQGVAIDMPAGPSELCVLADESADPKFIAADLLSQAEHGGDSQVLLVCTSTSVVDACLKEIESQLNKLSRKEVAAKALQNSKAIIFSDMDTAISLVNEYAAEHLIINCEDADATAQKITSAGSVFIGPYSPESVGDYASGTNHTLPTNGFARAYSGVSIDSFVKKITYQKLTKEGLKGIAQTVITMAEAEGLGAHAEAVRVRS